MSGKHRGIISNKKGGVMRFIKNAIVPVVMLLLVSSTVIAGDFDWISDLNVKAEADLSGFKAQLTTKFKVGDAQVSAVISNVDKPADAYMVLRLGEMSNQPLERVITEYKAGKGKGWGVIAKNLGIKPGSKEFHALKAGHDLGGGDSGPGSGKGRGRGKHK